LRSFQHQDPVKSQKMMRARVAAQLATIVVVAVYQLSRPGGFANVDFRLAPMYQDKLARDAAAAAAEKKGTEE
jgi:hypothetical protein